MMGKYRRKPVIVEAEQFTNPEKHWDLGIIWVMEEDEMLPGKKSYFKVATLAGEMKISLGDWIIKGAKGENYGCSPVNFKKHYEKC